MHVLIAVSGSFGDVYPFVGLGRTLRQRGHAVTFCTSEYFRAAVEAEQLEFLPVGSADEYAGMIRHPDLWHPTRGIRFVLERATHHMPAVYETLRARYEPGHTVLVASTLAFAARVLRETHGGSLVTIHLAPNLFRSLEVPVHAAGGPLLVHAPKWLRRAFWWLIDRAAIDPVLAPALNDFRRQLGLRAPVRRVFRDWIHSPDRVIGLFPDWFAPPRSDWPEQARLTGFPLYDAADHEPVPDGLAEFLAAGPPPVLFAPGSVNTAAGEFFATSLAACEKAGRRAILVSRYGSQTERTLPAWARHFSYLPFSTVLPRMSAFVSHGGIGSISQGLRAGVPQLVRPMGFDQFENGALVERLGVARMLPVRRYTPDTVAAALDALAAAECAQACRSVADRFNGMDGLAAAAAIIEQTATR